MILQDALPQSRRIAALLDLLEAFSGCSLAIFLWLHMAFVASIYLGADRFDGIARFLDERYLSYVGIPPLILLFFLHFLLAARKIPTSWGNQRVLWSHAGRLGHRDTWTWIFQVVSGMGILILASIHFWVVLTAWPIESAMSAYRIRQVPYLIFYILLLILGELHAGFGLYRLAVKWGWPPRRRAELFFELIGACVIIAGLGALVMFWKSGG